ncbi:MAG: SpaA isopeptide-forming pilin-related protein [Lachnospiraceae bacterium]
MRERKWMKKVKGKTVITIIMVIALLIGAVSGTFLFNQGLADEFAQDTKELKEENVNIDIVEGTKAENSSEAIEETETVSESETDEGVQVENTIEDGEIQEAEEEPNDANAQGEEPNDVSEEGEEPNDASAQGEEPNDESAQAKNELVMPREAAGINLFFGANKDDFIGTYDTWANLVTGIKNHGIGAYSIDLNGVDLTPQTNWSTAFNTNSDTGNAQYYLHFYSKTNNKLTLVSGSTMGAHVEFHEGLTLDTPESDKYGMPLNSQRSSATQLSNGYDSAYILANGWRFIVNKGVNVEGRANLYAGTLSTSDFTRGKTIENNLKCGYVQVNAGQWRYIGASIGSIVGAYQIIIGNDDNPNKPVYVDAVFGRENGNMNTAGHSSIVIPNEYIEVMGNTVVTFGVACLIDGYSTYSAGTNVQKVVIGGNASVLKTWGAVDQEILKKASVSDKNYFIRTSVTAGAVGNGYGHYNDDVNIVNIIVDIRDHAYIAGDIVGIGANMYFDVNNNSKGIHISINDYAQVGGNVVYGGSSSAGQLTPEDSVDNPFFTMEVNGAADSGGVKIGGHLLATNGEDRSYWSSWAAATRVKNAVVNGSVFGYGNLATEQITTGINIKDAAINIDNSIIGGGVYGVATGGAGRAGACQNISITIKDSTVGHVAPLFTYYDRAGGNASDYYVGGSKVDITNSKVTGRTVMWLPGVYGSGIRNLPTYSFVTADSSGTKTKHLKALATITVEGGQRRITFNTDNTDKYEGIELAATRPEISLTTSMNAQATGGMDLAGYTISLAARSGSHEFSVKDTDFTRTNGNPLVVIMDRGDGTLGKNANATVTIDNCHATASGKKIDAAVFGQLSGTVTSAKVKKMTMNLKNTNDLAKVGFAQRVTGANLFINTEAMIIMDNTVVENLFGKGGENHEQLRNAASDTLRVQFQFKNHNTLSTVEANGADVVFCQGSVTYLSGFFNNTGSSVFDKEYVKTESGARVYLGNSGTSATRTTLGDAKQQRVFGSISGTAGQLYIYKDTGSGAAGNATYPIYVAEGGSILEAGMNLGEWSSSDRTIVTQDKDTVLNASSGKVKKYTVIEPDTTHTKLVIQEENDILIAFATTANALAGRINDIPLRLWPIIRYSDANADATAKQKGWLILGRPRYQVIYQGSGIQEDNESVAVEGKIGSDSLIVRKGVGTSDDYIYLLEDNSADRKSYTIEDYKPTATKSNQYTFLYWRLYGSTEGNNRGMNEDGVLIPENWSFVQDCGIENYSGENSWAVGDSFTLKNILESGVLKREYAKVLTLVPVYRANYVCKIGDQAYLELSDAFTAISNDTAAVEDDGSYQIKMLVEEYPIDQEYIIGNGWNVTITTAGESDAVLPYKGTPQTRATLIRSDAGGGYKGYFFVNQGTLTLTNINLDGNSNKVSGDSFIKVDAGASLNLSGGSTLQNNQTNVGMTASAVRAEDATSTIRLYDTVIQNNVVLSDSGGGAIMSGNVILEGKVMITDNYRKCSGESDVKSNICLDAGGTVRIEGSLVNSVVGIRVQDGNHVDEYEFAETSSQASANASYQYFSDDFEDSMGIMVSTSNPSNIMFKGSVPFSFTKVKAEDTTKILPGVEFKLYRLICEDSSHNHADTTALVTQDSIGVGECWELAATKLSSTAGLTDFEKLEKGTYMLVETKAAGGYKLPSGQWLIKVTPTGSDKIGITAHGAQDDLPPAFMKVTANDGTVTYKLPNVKQLSLPLSGMPGIQLPQIVGLVLMLLTTLLYILRK